MSIIYDLKPVLTRLKKIFVSGVKGNAETSYRTGNINITPANIGLGNVNNTADADKSVKSVTKIESTYDGTSGYQELMTWTGSKGTDYAYIRCGMTASDEGYLELSTADNGDSPIYVKQYGVGGVSQTANARVATLLDKSGNTIFPGNVTASSFIGKSTSADNDGSGNNIAATYLTELSVSGKLITYTKGNGKTATITMQDTTYNAATQTVAGLMSADDKKKLDGIAAGANAYSLPAATSSELGGVKIGSNITHSNGMISLTKANVTTALGYTPQDTHFTTKLIVGASNSTTNTATTNGNTYLRLFDDTTARNSIKITGSGATTVKSDASGIITIDSGNTTYNNASQSVAGLMSVDDKKKLDGIAAGAQVNSVVGVKGNAETSYRTGNVNITPANIGLGNVNNTADSDKNVNSATKDGNGNNIVNTYAVKPKIKSFTIPTTNWKSITTSGDYKYYYDFTVANLTADDVVTMNLAPSSQSIATTCGLCATNESFSGKIRLYAKTVPSASMSGDYYVLKCVRE